MHLQLIAKYRPASEKLSDAQLELLELEPGVSDMEVQAESEHEPLPKPSSNRRNGKHPGRQLLPADLPRVEKVISCSPEQGTCRVCGQGTAVIGYEESERLDVEPARYFVAVTKREKRACRCCAEGGVTALRCRCGSSISRATLDGWVMRAGELLAPVVAVVNRELLAGSYIQADEAPVGVQMHDGRGKNQQAWLWEYGRPGGGVVFDFRLGRRRGGPKRFLGQFEGILQSDGYAAYDNVGGPKMVHAACWAHSRRSFLRQ